MSSASKRGILERLTAGVVLGDGGYVLELERRGYVQAGAYTPEVALEHPEALRNLHLEFKQAGAEVLQALTFYGSEDKLAFAGQAHRVEAINRAAVRIAREVAAEDALVAGTLTRTPSFRMARDAKRTRRVMAQQAEIQADAGVDFVIGETFDYLQEALIAVKAIHEAGLAAMITMEMSEAGSADGHSPEECARRLAEAGAAIIGVNCSYDPCTSIAVAARMRSAAAVHIACQPAGYRTADPRVTFYQLPEFPLALERHQLSRFALEDFTRRARDLGIRYIGGCCGVAAHHVRAMAEALGRRPEGASKSPDLARHMDPRVSPKVDPAYWRALGIREQVRG